LAEGGGLALLAAGLGAAPARAASLVIADAEAPPEARAEADAVAFLLRQSLDSPLRPVTPSERLRDTLFPAGAKVAPWW
jgi:hypothetical protein